MAQFIRTVRKIMALRAQGYTFREVDMILNLDMPADAKVQRTGHVSYLLWHSPKGQAVRTLFAK